MSAAPHKQKLSYDKVSAPGTATQEKRKKEFMKSAYVLAPVGLIGGIASYITNNMGKYPSHT